jgi:aldehyde:ferredoxin oxidoreductase
VFGRTLIVDLTKGKVCQSQIEPDVQSKFLGGRGLNSFLLNRFLEPKADPLSPNNLLIVSTGPLTGTQAPASGRFTVSAKSPETGFLGDGNCGGFWAPMLRRSGFDVLILKGRSAHPVYVFIEASKAEILRAVDLWGLDTNETQRELKGSHPGSESICIGQAGENLVRFACVRTGLKNAAGRTGMGAVMGSKNLKAVVARGSGKVETAHPKELEKKRSELTKKILDRKVVQALQKYGTPYLVNILDASQKLGTRNFRESHFEEVEQISGDELATSYSLRKVGCFGCPVRCRHVYSLDGETAEGPEFATIGCMGAKCGVSSMKTILKANSLCNKYGLDTITTGSLIAWLIECAEKKMLPDGVVDQGLSFGDSDAVLGLIEKIALRKGVGDVLAEGGLRAAQKLNPKTERFLFHVKGLPIEAADVRWNMGFALGLAVAARGGDHLRNRPTLENLDLPPQLLEKLCGGKISPDPLSTEGKPLMVKWAEELYAVTDSLGICRFVSLWNSPNLLGFKELSALYNLVAGTCISPEDLVKVGERVVNAERMFNLKEGISKRDDRLPLPFFDSPRMGKKCALTPTKMSVMLNEYYVLRGWKKTGVPKKAKLDRLEVDSNGVPAFTNSALGRELACP